jgi:hypothetical protein
MKVYFFSNVKLFAQISSWEPGLGVGGHMCNSNYSGGSDQEDCGSKPARANVLKTLS